VWVPQPTATRGTSEGTLASAPTAAVCGAMTMIPATPWSRSRSTASSTERRSNVPIAATVTKCSYCLDACSMP
jgi:hypothetical protein